MRKLIAAVIILAVLFGLYSVADVLLRQQAEHTIANRIERKEPGSHATASISSFPFTGYLAVSGDVPKLDVTVTGVTVDSLSFESIRLVVHDLKVNRSQLIHGKVDLKSIRQADIYATVTQAAFDKVAGVPLTFGNGTVGVSGVGSVSAQFTVSDNKVSLKVGSLPAITVPIPLSSVLPCVGSAVAVQGALQLSCTTDTIPPALLAEANSQAA